jgi:hypothetical protein
MIIPPARIDDVNLIGLFTIRERDQFVVSEENFTHVRGENAILGVKSAIAVVNFFNQMVDYLVISVVY